MSTSHDLIVVGAGPGGSTAATVAARAGLRVLMLDKDTFPRDKICGDAISGKSVDVLRELGLLDLVVRDESLGSWGVTFSGPSGDVAAIPFSKFMDAPVAPGFVSRREVFDDILFRVAGEAGAEIWQNANVSGIVRREDGTVEGVTVSRDGGDPQVINAPLIVGADGAYSVVARDLGMEQLAEKHYCAGLRAYYEGVTGFHPKNFIEIHFVDESIPGYFWIFPMPNGRANVGIGMLSAAVKKRKVKLKPLLDQLVDHPRFKERFANARRIGPVRGWGLPLGSKPRPMAGNGWMLVGDAASLIDPFTGEGIGNAMVSGWRAGEWAARAIEAGRFDKAFLRDYESEVLDRLRNELRLSHMMQRLGNWKWLLDTVIRKASRSEELADLISCMFDDLDERRRLVSPLFYLRVLKA